MLAGVPPFHDDDDLELMKKVKKGLVPESVETTIPSRFFFVIAVPGTAETIPCIYLRLIRPTTWVFLPEIPTWIHTEIKV